jgi:hypothetical protein
VSGLDGEMKAIFEPLTGHAWWRAWQNRYLAGIIANAIGYVPFFVFGFIALNIVTYYLYDKNIWIVFAQMGAFFLMRWVPYWFLGWDLLDILMMVILLTFIKNKVGLIYYVILFSVFLFNRESAFYIPAYLLLSILFEKKERGWKIFLASLMVMFGIMIIYRLRQNFDYSCVHWVGLDNDYQFHNLHGGWELFVTNVKCFFYVGLSPAIVLGTMLFVKRNAIGILIWLIWATLMVFGQINELRVYLILVPLLIYEFRLQKIYKNNT